MTILVIDDSATMVMSLARILKKAGYGVETASDGAEAVAKIEAGLRPDLILTDLNMPEMDGLTFIRTARRMAATRATPILVLTMESCANASAEAMAEGATGWLTKPARQGELLAVVQQFAPVA